MWTVIPAIKQDSISPFFKSWQERFPYRETGTRLMAQSFLLRCKMDQDYRKKMYKEVVVIHKTEGKDSVQDI